MAISGGYNKDNLLNYKKSYSVEKDGRVYVHNLVLDLPENFIKDHMKQHYKTLGPDAFYGYFSKHFNTRGSTLRSVKPETK
jgi:hypothetical protein